MQHVVSEYFGNCDSPTPMLTQDDAQKTCRTILHWNIHVHEYIHVHLHSLTLMIANLNCMQNALIHTVYRYITVTKLCTVTHEVKQREHKAHLMKGLSCLMKRPISVTQLPQVKKIIVTHTWTKHEHACTSAVHARVLRRAWLKCIYVHAKYTRAWQVSNYGRRLVTNSTSGCKCILIMTDSQWGPGARGL